MTHLKESAFHPSTGIHSDLKTPLLWSLLGAVLSACSTLPAHPPADPQRFQVLGSFEVQVGEARGLQKQDIATSSFQLKQVRSRLLDQDGYRYISATYRVRNASSSGAPSPTARKNLTFLAVETQNTLQKTAIRGLKKADGTAANPLLALQVLPAAHFNAPGTLDPAQSMQAFSFSETARLKGLPSTVLNVFPYGYVVDRVGGGRILDAHPLSTDYQGEVTISVKVPLQDPVSETPTSITLNMLFAEDTITQVTESLEEQNQAGSNLSARVTLAGASRVSVFPDSLYGGLKRTLCRVPVSSGTPPAFLVNSRTPVTGFEPRINGLASSNNPINALLGPCDDFTPLLSSTAPEQQMVIQGFQTGKRMTHFNGFNGGTYSSSEGMWTYTPAPGAFFKPGEWLEVSVPHQTDVQGRAHRFQVGSRPETRSGFEAITWAVDLSSPREVALGDVNGDGKLDAVVANFEADTVSVLTGNGDGTLRSQASFAVGDGPITLALGDLNGDGKLDLVVPDANSTTLSVLLGNGDGTFQPRTPHPVASMPRGVEMTDLNNDGHLDVLVTNFAPGQVKVLLGNGDGTLQTVQGFIGVYSGGTARRIAAGDFNNDGLMDVLLANTQAENSALLLNAGNGKPTGLRRVQTGSYNNNDVTLGDVNGDGHLDAVVVSPDLEAAIILLGDGQGRLTATTASPVGTDPHGVALGDVNGDGRLDLVTANHGSSSISVLLGNGNGTFQPHVPYTVGPEPYGVALGDMNGDGRLDIVQTSEEDSSIRVFLKH